MDRTYEDLLRQWPKDSEGNPEKPVFFKKDCDLSGYGNITCSILAAFGIPYYTNRPGIGEIMFIRGGFTPEGIDIYVPISRLQEAVELCNAAAQPADESEEETP